MDLQSTQVHIRDDFSHFGFFLIPDTIKTILCLIEGVSMATAPSLAQLSKVRKRNWREGERFTSEGRGQVERLKVLERI